MTQKYYSLENILNEHSIYNLIIGERSNGKTYATLQYCLEQYIQTGHTFAYIRRWEEDFKSKRGAKLFDNLVTNDAVKILTNGEWDNVYYWSSRWYLARTDEKGLLVKASEPFCYAFALTSEQHEKSSSFPDIYNVVFDEFITRDGYLHDEFISFTNLLSTIIRRKEGVTIFMLGNTVNQYCPYFAEMGIEDVKNMPQGTIRTYSYGDTKLRVSVEYCADMSSVKENNYYFAFNNPKLKMITTGVWELDIYPHCPEKYKPKDILFTYFIEFVDDLLQCEIVQTEAGNNFTFIHRKTTPVKYDSDLIYSQKYSPSPFHYRNLLKAENKICSKIKSYYDTDRVYYSDNMVGEIVRNYILWCQTEK